MEVEELESLLGPEDSEVDFRRILEEARNKKGRAISQTFSSEGPSEFLAVRARRDEHRRKLRAQKEVSITPPMLQQKSFSSTNERQWQADLEEQRSVWSSPEKVPVALEDHLEKCIDMKVEIAALELLLEPEQAVVCLRYILKHACKEDRQQHFRDLRHQRERRPLGGQQEALARREGSLARKVAKRLARHGV